MRMWSNVQLFRGSQHKVTTPIESAQNGIGTIQDDHHIEVAAYWENCIPSWQLWHLRMCANTKEWDCLNRYCLGQYLKKLPLWWGRHCCLEKCLEFWPFFGVRRPMTKKGWQGNFCCSNGSSNFCRNKKWKELWFVQKDLATGCSMIVAVETTDASREVGRKCSCAITQYFARRTWPALLIKCSASWTTTVVAGLPRALTPSSNRPVLGQRPSNCWRRKTRNEGQWLRQEEITDDIQAQNCGVCKGAK